VLIEGLGFTPIQLGLFFAGTVMIVFAAGMLGDVHFRPQDTFRATFNSIEGITDKSPVKIFGVEVGSVKSVELERLIAQGLAIIERRNSFEAFRDIAAGQYELVIGSAWRPRSGSITNRKTLTAAIIDSRDFIAAKRRADIEPLLPTGPRIAFTGGVECNDHVRIWDALDKTRARHADMVLIHGGGGL